MKGIKGGAAPRRPPGLGIPGRGRGAGAGSPWGVWGSSGWKLQWVGGIRGETEGSSEGTAPRDDRSRPLKGQGALEGSFVLWRKGRRRGRENGLEGEDCGARALQGGGSRSEGQPPNFLLPGALGTFRPQERLSRRRRSPQRLVGRVGKRLLPAPRRGPAAPG